MNTQKNNEQQLVILVTGMVQGVWFRQSTKQVAQQLGICGYAKNLADGQVEVFAVGSNKALEQLSDFLHQGPEQARVDFLTVTVVSRPRPSGFKTG